MNITQLRKYKIQTKLGDVSFSWNDDHPSLWWVCLKINRRWEHIDLRWLLSKSEQSDFLHSHVDRVERLDMAKNILERHSLDNIKKYLADAEQVVAAEQNRRDGKCN